ncbi:hypothetical protein HPP92_018281 [Vanilla planifolia]|uniref:ABC transporter domain-containing protein n=1 Tax=Vanilla planifolia TaxID=51239 RepID=A0A835Q5F5_VANPL|nr:hypothetical protein HPP92_018281 [Vanilla planifolia]
MAKMENLSSSKLRTMVLSGNMEGREDHKQFIDVTKLGDPERKSIVDKLIKNVESDNRRLLQKQRERMQRVDVKVPTIEVRYKNLCVDAECEIVDGKPLPTLWNTIKSMISNIQRAFFWKPEEKISILRDVSGIIKSSRITLLLGPPGSGKTTLMLALAGKLHKSTKVSGEISYNGFKLEEFIPEKTSAYVSQHDLHIAEMTVRETLDFSARFQGVGIRGEIVEEVIRREKEQGITPEPDIDMFMQGTALNGLEQSLQTDYILKITGMDGCAQAMVGNAMRRGISGGEMKRLTIGEMLVGPAKLLLMDEISTGLDSSTAFQIVTCLQQLAQISEATILVSLLQPTPEIYDLFDDIILISEGKIVYHGPRTEILEFFEECGFKCPERKGVGDFLQEILTKKDQEQYWSRKNETYNYVNVEEFSEKFEASRAGQMLYEELSKPYDKSKSHKDALIFGKYTVPKWELLRCCIVREILLMKRNLFIYIFKTNQIMIIATITTTVFLRTQMGVDLLHANYHLGSLFYSLMILLVNAIPELSMTVSRLPIFYKQRDMYFYPAWAYAIPTSLLKIPLSLLESLLWTSITYYGIGYSPEVTRFLSQFLILFCVHQMSLSMFRFLASYFQTLAVSAISGSFSLLTITTFGGFILAKPSMPVWLSWGFWTSPSTYAQIGLAVNEFRGSRWQKTTTNRTIGELVLTSRGLNYEDYFYWISVGALIGFIVLFNAAVSLSLTFRRSLQESRVIISREKLHKLQPAKSTSAQKLDLIHTSGKRDQHSRMSTRSQMMVLSFVPLPITFQNVQYFIDTPMEMRRQGYPEEKLKLLCDINGAFCPGKLSAIMGVTGAGKTTLLDVISGKVTGGTIEGEIKIGGNLKVKESFVRMLGYCEQTDNHSPHVTVEESVIFSAWLRLPPEVDSKTRKEFVKEVLETVELDGIKDSLVGLPGINGLSTEQRKRLTIAVELVSNPSIILMDEPTSGLDARAAAIIMRTVKTVAETGRTVACTIHQPSIDIFEAFDELLLMKRGGQLIYSGPIGQQSCKVIEYFEAISGIPKIMGNYNPATWIMEVTSTSLEAQLGIDLTCIYKKSDLHRLNQDLVKHLSSPTQNSKESKFPSHFKNGFWEQFRACLWKQYLSYWRAPQYNLARITFVILLSSLLAALFWQHGTRINNQQDLFNIFGSLFIAIIFMGINNCSTAIPMVAIEQTVFYRERFARMYSPCAHSAAKAVIELPYVFFQVVMFVSITYPTIGYYWSISKFSWFFFAIFSTLLYYAYLGMLLMSLSPNSQVAMIFSSFCYPILSLFAGYILPGPQMPKWWSWLYHSSPTSWTLRGILTSQYGDIHKEIIIFGEPKSISSFLEDYYGFQHDQLGITFALLILYPLIFASMFAYFTGRLNFQRR